MLNVFDIDMIIFLSVKDMLFVKCMFGRLKEIIDYIFECYVLKKLKKFFLLLKKFFRKKKFVKCIEIFKDFVYRVIGFDDIVYSLLEDELD